MLERAVEAAKRISRGPRGRLRLCLGMFLLLAVAAVALMPSALSPYRPDELSGNPFEPPSRAHWAGTDNLGKDLFSRIIWGARPSVVLAFGATALSLLFGVALGAISGFYGGWVDAALSRLFEIFLTIPRLFLAILMVSFFGTSVWIMTIVIGVTMWATTARLARAQVLSLRGRTFVVAAHSQALSGVRILFGHVLPNGLGPVLANSTVQMSQAVLLEASLSFLGFGDQNHVTWGHLLQGANAYMQSGWWMMVFPGAVIVLFVLGLQLVGDELTARLNPRLTDG